MRFYKPVSRSPPKPPSELWGPPAAEAPGLSLRGCAQQPWGLEGKPVIASMCMHRLAPLLAMMMLGFYSSRVTFLLEQCTLVPGMCRTAAQYVAAMGAGSWIS